jgi:hypothetical protein
LQDSGATTIDARRGREISEESTTGAGAIKASLKETCPAAEPPPGGKGGGGGRTTASAGEDEEGHMPLSPRGRCRRGEGRQTYLAKEKAAILHCIAISVGRKAEGSYGKFYNTFYCSPKI